MQQRPVFSAPATGRWIALALLSATVFAFSNATAFADDLLTAANPQIPGGPSLQFTGAETGSFDSNPLMLLHGAQPLWGSITTPELTFNGKTPTSLLSLDALVNENIFNHSNFNSTDLHSKANFTEQMQRWGFQVQQNTDYDTTRTSELFPTALNGQIQNVPVRHLGLALAPQVSYNPTTIDKITLAGSIQDSQYDNPIFANYGQASLTPTYMHNFDPLNAGTISVQAQRYQSTSGPQVFDDSVGPQIGWIGKLTPRFTVQVSGGVQASRQFGSGAVQKPWSLQYIYASDIAFNGIQDTVHFLANRTDYPFGNGTESLLTTFSLTESHAINQRFSMNGGASYQSADYLSSNPGGLQYLLSGNGGLTYHATERLDIAATYQYRREKLISTPGNAQDNTVTLGLTWRPQAWGL